MQRRKCFKQTTHKQVAWPPCRRVHHLYFCTHKKKIMNLSPTTKNMTVYKVNILWHIKLPYFGKRKQVTKVKFLVKEQNVFVISTDANEISLWILPNISLGRMSVDAWNLAWKKSTLGKIWNINNCADLDGICHLLPFAKVGQYSFKCFHALCNVHVAYQTRSSRPPCLAMADLTRLAKSTADSFSWYKQKQTH